MKKILLCTLIIAIGFFIIGSTNAAVTRQHGMKWRGYWYLRGASECRTIELDRYGRTTIGVYPKAVVEQKARNYYISVESFGKKYSYKMTKRDDSGFDLDLISIGPYLSLPMASSTPMEGAYSAIFRKLVDCQTTAFEGVIETNTK